jgi:hypothetical protein
MHTGRKSLTLGRKVLSLPSTLKMKATHSAKLLINVYQPIWHHMLNDSKIQRQKYWAHTSTMCHIKCKVKYIIQESHNVATVKTYFVSLNITDQVHYEDLTELWLNSTFKKTAVWYGITVYTHAHTHTPQGFTVP